MDKIRIFILGVSMLVFLAGCSSPGTKRVDVSSIQGMEVTATGPSYKIGPGDQLSIFVWGNSDLSTDVTVRPDGYITAPLVEDVKASGSTAADLASEIRQRLAKYIKTPNVTVSISGFVGRYEEQVRVVGQAVQPQALRYKDKMTVLDVIIAVGGLTEFADGNDATIIREVDGKKIKISVYLDDLIQKGMISKNIAMKPGDILIIPESWF